MVAYKQKYTFIIRISNHLDQGGTLKISLISLNQP